MSFIKKTEAELTAMTAEQRDAYGVEKTNHELEVAKQAATKEIDAKIDALKEELEKSKFSKDSDEFKALETQLKNMETSLEDLGKKIPKQEEKEFELNFKASVAKALKDNHEKLKRIPQE